MIEGQTDNIIPLRQQVEERICAESAQIAKAAAEKEKQPTAGGPDDPRFVRQCLEANERGDGVLAAALHRGKFVYVKSRDEKSKAWFRFNGVHWEVDKADDHMIIPENVALVYQREADRLTPEIAEARTALEAANSKIKYYNGLAKELKKDGIPEQIAACNTEGKAAEEESLHAKIALSGLTRLQKDYADRVDRLRALRGAKNCLEFSHKIGPGGLYIYGDEVDQKPNLIPCRNCVIDLETGEPTVGQPEDFLVRALPINYVPGMARPAWEKFISEIHEDDAEKVALIKRWWGYCLTGHVREQMYIMFTGDGANGKGTMLEIAQEIFGELAKQIMAEMLVKTRNVRSSTGASPDILSLYGRRWVFVDETNDGDRVNDAEIKRTTGGNRRSGRGLFDKFDTDFRPTHKLSIVTNHPLKGIAETYSLKRRLIYLHYPLIYDPAPEAAAENDPGNAHRYRRIDKLLDQKLRDELEGVLAWMVEGAMEWYLTGLAVPQCLLDAVEQVKVREDTLGQFLAARARLGEHCEMPAKDFLTAYQKWYTEEGHSEKWKPTRNVTYDKLRAKGIRIPDNRTTGGTTTIFGLDLNPF
jgi:putative DNA primase/helicase